MRALLAAAVLAGASGCTRPNPFYAPEGGGAGGGGGGAGGGGGTAEGEGEGGDPGDPGDPGEGQDPGPAGDLPAAALTLTVPDEVLEDEAFEAVLSATDERGEPTTRLSGELTVRADRGDVRPSSFTLRALPGGRVSLNLALNREGVTRLKVGATGADGRALFAEAPPLRVRTRVYLETPEAPVLSRGARDAWDDRDVSQPSVLWVPEGAGGGLSGKLLMYYRGRDAALVEKGIGVALSEDGVEWRRSELNPVLPSEEVGPGRYSDYSEPEVRLDGGRFRMWVTRTQGSTSIAQGVSNDGLTWTLPEPNPVILPAPREGWDELWVFAPAVVRSRLGWEAWYGIFTTDGKFGVGRAVSADGVAWDPWEQNPVLSPGPEAQWDGVTVDKPSVVLDGTVYRMWYTGDRVFRESGDDAWSIGYATSVDGVTWERSPDNPVVRPSGAEGRYDKVRVANPSALRLADPHDPDRATILLYHDGFDGARWSVGLANPPG